jgi:23S rRNA pseudouridine1911/1915/1917 synthase
MLFNFNMLIDNDNEDEFFHTVSLYIDPKQECVRIDKYLSDRLGRISRNRIQQAIRAGAVLVDSLPVKPNYKIKPGNSISAVFPRHFSDEEAGKIQPQYIPLDIVYEDEDVLIINKQAGLVVHPGVGNWDGTLVNGLAHYLGLDHLTRDDESFQNRVGLVHRIDKNTSGLLVIAKNDYALSFLAKQFSDHSIERTYYALVWGTPEPPKGKIEGHIGRNPRDRKRYLVFPDGDEGKWAITHYETMENFYYVSLVKCNLETGRTHQIRVHFNYIGHPLFNDEKYGGSAIVKGTPFSKYKDFVHNSFQVLPRQALHAGTLGFIHPTSKQFVRFECDLPQDFKECLQRWRKYYVSRRV